MKRTVKKSKNSKFSKIVLINIGANSKGVGRGPIFSDGTFKYLPVPEGYSKGVEFRFPRYSDLQLSKYLKKKDKERRVHYDPNFENFTYGHITRGYGYEYLLGCLEKGDILAFYATSEYNGEEEPEHDWIDTNWGTYIIGSFFIKAVQTQSDFENLEYKDRMQFINNPHFLRIEHGADLWISGLPSSPGLFPIAFPLHSQDDNLTANDFLQEYFTTSGDVTPEKNYFRFAMICEEDVKLVWRKIKAHCF